MACIIHSSHQSNFNRQTGSRVTGRLNGADWSLAGTVLLTSFKRYYDISKMRSNTCTIWRATCRFYPSTAQIRRCATHKWSKLQLTTAMTGLAQSVMARHGTGQSRAPPPPPPWPCPSSAGRAACARCPAAAASERVSQNQIAAMREQVKASSDSVICVLQSVASLARLWLSA